MFDIRNIDQAFENAIEKGLKDYEDYMYMYSDFVKQIDFFKHLIKKNYKEISYKESIKL